MIMKEKKNNVHSGHRQRVKSKFVEANSLDSFNDIQILELMLFYCIPMKDTNELAHKLLDNYGSLYNLFNANINDLMDRCGITENIAVFITMMPHIYRRYMRSKLDDKVVKFDNPETSGAYFLSLLHGKEIEELYMLCLNAKKQIIRTVCISTGNVNSTDININKIIENAVLSKCSYVIIGHNHPADSPNPSRQDIEATNTVRNTLKVMNVNLIDHIIVCGDGYLSLAARGNCFLKY